MDYRDSNSLKGSPIFYFLFLDWKNKSRFSFSCRFIFLLLFFFCVYLIWGIKSISRREEHLDESPLSPYLLFSPQSKSCPMVITIRRRPMISATMFVDRFVFLFFLTHSKITPFFLKMFYLSTSVEFVSDIFLLVL